MERFAERLPEELPGSEVDIYYAGALYDIPEAFEAMADGTLEMTFLQVGKAAPVDPLSLVIVGPGRLTTIGAVDAIDEFETMERLTEQYEEVHGVTTLGVGHLSHGMGMAGPERYGGEVSDYEGSRVRTSGPIENAVLDGWGASPTVMDFGEAPSALEAGVIDAVMTSVGGWESMVDIAPYYTTGEGPGVFTADYYLYTASQTWWETLTEEQQDTLTELFQDDIVPFQRVVNYCVDQRAFDEFATDDPDEQGVYQLTEEEMAELDEALGDAIDEFVMEETPEEGDEWLELFKEEAEQAVEENPLGESWIEETDCEEEGYYDLIERAEEEAEEEEDDEDEEDEEDDDAS
jgi:TRAP-type C4-dicarboxylate transport system substrate-binding protein